MLIYRQTIVVLRGAAATDEYGNASLNWASAARVAVADVSVQPVSQDELTDAQRDAAVSQWRVITDKGVDLDVTALDRVELSDGTVCEVVGQPARWPSPRTGEHHHTELTVQAVEG